MQSPKMFVDVLFQFQSRFDWMIILTQLFFKSSLIFLKCIQLQFMLSFKNSVECVKDLKPYLHTPLQDLNPRTSGPEAHTMTTFTKIFKNIFWLPWLDLLVSTTPAEIGTFGSLHRSSPARGCQIFLRTKYQNGKNIPNFPRTIPNDHKI
jgi:hypothetical protein